MANLHNRISQKELKERLYQETEPRVTFSFYQYFSIEHTRIFRDELYRNLNALNIFGRIYIAREGINAQASVPISKYEAAQDYLRSIPGLENLRFNLAVDSYHLPEEQFHTEKDAGTGHKHAHGSFWVLKVKVRDKIVADGITDPHFDMTQKGRYVNAEDFNRLTDDPDTVVVDMRNHYEYEVGHFENAIEIPSDTFREQLPMAVNILQEQKDKNIIMYCTGGIRCEKASAYLLHHGFNHVFHLEGGIIHYANSVKQQNLPNKFRGKNFVFDNRLGEKVGDEIISKCHQCGLPCDAHANCLNNGCHLLFIQCKSCAAKYDGCCSQECQTVYNMPEDVQKEIRKGKVNGIMVFNKSRHRLTQTIKH